MFSLQPRKQVKVVLFALATLALTAGNASAIVINFEEFPDGSIHVTGDLNVVKPASETFRISAPNCNCGADATLNGIGTSTEFLVDILDSAGGPISDQVWVHRVSAAAGSQVIDFHSEDGNPFATGGANAMITSVVETGSLQPVLTYTSMGGATVNISISSPLEVSVPEPTTLALLGVSLLGIATARRRATPPMP
jgi:hypothetical protein